MTSAKASRSPSADPEVARTLGLGSSTRKRTWIRVGLALGIVALGGLAGARYMQARKRASAPTFQSAPVERGDLRVTVSATGKIQGLNTVEVGAEVSGRITKVHVDFNDHVKSGQLLAEIDPEQLKASIEEASARVASSEASIRQARATLTEAQASAARAEAQAQHGLMSQRELEAARATATRAEAMVQSALAEATVTRAALKSARWKLDRTKIVAPISGIVLSRLIEPGQTVTAGFQTPILFKLTEDLTRMSLHVYVDEADVGRVKEGQEASFAVDAYPERVFPSKVLSLRNEPRVDQNVVSYEAVLAVDNSELLLRPGMTATATIVTELRRDVLLVPNAALRFTPPLPAAEPRGKPPSPPQPSAGKQVWVLQGEPPTPSAINVKIGPSDGIKTELTSELAQGTEVLTDIVDRP